MAISIGRAIASALSGTAKGLAKGAVAADERRDKYTQVALAAGIKKAQALEEKRIEEEAEAAEEAAAVKSLMSFSIDGKLLTKAEATKIHQTAKAEGKSATEILKNYTIQSENGGSIRTVSGKERAVLPTMEGIVSSDEGGFLGVSPTEGLAEEVQQLLKASGYEASITMPSTTEVTGVRLTPIADKDVDFSNEYILDENGTPLEQVIARREYDKRTGSTKITYLSKIDGSEIKPAGNQRVASAANAFTQDKPYADMGPLITFGKDGLPSFVTDENGKIVSGYLMKNGEIRLQKAGKIADSVYTPPDDQTVLVAGKDYAPSVAGGDLSAWGKIFKFPPVKDFYKALPEMDTAANANDLLFSRSQKRLELHAKYGDSMYGLEGGFADLVVSTDKTISGAANVVVSLAGLDTSGMSDEEALNAKVQFLESSGNINMLRDLADNKDAIMSQGFVDKQAEIAMARTIDAAIATVTAYDLAKQTGDTRISNQDFDAYISTVTGNTAEQTIKLIKNGLEDSLTIYTSKHSSLVRARNRIPDVGETEQYQETFDKALTTVEPPSEYRKRFNEMFKPFEEKKAPKPVSIGEIIPKLIEVDGGRRVSISIKGQEPVTLKNPRYLRLFDEAVSEEEKDNIKQDIQTAINRILEARAGN